jgi:hypothetical protein
MIYDYFPDVGIIVSDFASSSLESFFARERRAGSLLAQLKVLGKKTSLELVWFL